MSTHDILLAVQYITISVLFIEILIVFAKWKDSIHSYLFLTCVSSFISNIGYLHEMIAKTEEAYIIALKLSYAGRVWVVFAFFLFAAKLCRRKIPKGLINLLVIIHVGIYISILMIGKNNFYYKDYRFSMGTVLPVFRHTNGNGHDILMGLNVILIVFGMTWVIMAFRREKNRIPRLRFFMLIMALGVQSLAFILQVTHVFRVSRYYDLTMPAALPGTICILIGILGFDLLGTREIARDFVIDRISEGIIAVDNEGRIRYYNEAVAKLYPEFDAFFAKKAVSGNAASKQVHTPYDILFNISNAVRTGETLTINERIYTPEENELQYRGESYGKLYALVDDTEHYRYMEELQKQRDIADSMIWHPSSTIW